MSDNIKQLMTLIEQNPKLPVVPLVDSDVCEDGYYARYLGELGYSHVNKYISGNYHLRLYDADPYEMYETVSDVLGVDAYENMSNEVIQQVYDNLPWIEAILVDINSL